MHASIIVGEAQNIFTVSVMRQTDKLFLSVSVLCVAHDSVFKETALKRSVCLLLSRSIRQDDPGCCQELFGDDAQTLCRCLLSQHIHQPLHREGNDSAAGNMGDAALQHIELSNNSFLSFIIFQQNHPNVMMIWYCNSVLLSEPMISS